MFKPKQALLNDWPSWVTVLRRGRRWRTSLTSSLILLGWIRPRFSAYKLVPWKRASCRMVVFHGIFSWEVHVYLMWTLVDKPPDCRYIIYNNKLSEINPNKPHINKNHREIGVKLVSNWTREQLGHHLIGPGWTWRVNGRAPRAPRRPMGPNYDIVGP